MNDWFERYDGKLFGTGTLGTMGDSYKNIVEHRVDLENLFRDDMYGIRDQIARTASNELDYQTIVALKGMLEKEKEVSDEDKVIGIVKGGFEKHFGMTMERFNEIYESIMETNPEKLI